MDVFDLYAKISLDSSEYDKGLSNAGETMKNFGKFAAAATGAAVAAAATGVIALTKQAVEAYAEYEQLIGGSKLMFGEAYEDVAKNARQAYKTVQMSQRDYLKQVNGFATGLKTSLGGNEKAAADLAHKIIVAQADVVAATGQSQEAVQNAFNGIMKGNFTMLDNLQIGITPTKEGFQEVIDKVNEWNKAQGNATKYQMGNLADMEAALVDYVAMIGMAEYAQNEASDTIEGSLASWKAAWSNLVLGVADSNADLTGLITDFVDSSKTLLGNILPIAEQALIGIAQLVSNAAPVILAEVPKLLEDLLPGLIDAVTSLLDSLMDSLPEIFTALSKVLPIIEGKVIEFIPKVIDFIVAEVPQFISAGLQLLTGLINGLTDNIDTIVPKLTQGVIDIVDQLIEIIETDGANIANAGLKFMTKLAMALITAVPDVLTQITQLIQDLSASLTNAANSEEGSFLTTATTILGILAQGLLDSVVTLVPQLTEAAAAFISQFAELAGSQTTDLVNSAFTILQSLATTLGDSGTIAKVMTDLTTAVMAIIDAIIDVITNLDINTFASACATIVKSLADGIVAAVGVITKKLPELITKIVEWLTNPDNLVGLADTALTLFGELVKDVPAILLALTDGLLGIITGIADYFKEHGDEIKEGFKTGLTTAFTNFKNNISSWWAESGKPTFDAIGQKFKDFFLHFEWGTTFLNFVNNIKKTISDKWELLKQAFTGENGFWGKVKKWFSEFDFVELITNFITNIKNAIEGAWDSFKQWFQSKISGLFSGIKVPNWIKKLFGKGEKAEDSTVMDEADETLVDMPENMVTLDYSLLNPIPEDTLSSFQKFADIIQAINDRIAGGEGSLGLNGLLKGLPDLFAKVVSAATELADYFTADLVNAINALVKHLCMTGTDDEGNVNAAGGNTLYTSMGWIFVLFNDIYVVSQLIAKYWSTEFIAASEKMRSESGLATGVLVSLAGVALGTAGAFDTMAASIWAAVGALMAYNMVSGAGTTKIPTSQVEGTGGGVGTVNVTFNGDVMGDEQGISEYVANAVQRGIGEAVYNAV